MMISLNFKPKKAKQHVLFHDIHDEYVTHHDNDTSFDHDSTAFDIDCPVSSIHAYATNFSSNNWSNPMTKSNNPKVRMPSEKWFGLDTQ